MYKILILNSTTVSFKTHCGGLVKDRPTEG